MKAITVEPGKPGTARLEDVPKPDVRDGSVRLAIIKCEAGVSIDAYRATRSLSDPGQLVNESSPLTIDNYWVYRRHRCSAIYSAGRLDCWSQSQCLSEDAAGSARASMR